MMRHPLMMLCLAAACSGTAAADVPLPQPLAPGGRIAAAKAQQRPQANVLSSPSIMQTTAVRMPDGSIGLVCEQKANPAAHAISVNKPFPEPQQ